MNNLSLARSMSRPHANLNLLQRLFLAYTLRQQRRALARLDADQLRDIGVTHADAQKEADRPAWDVPQNWRQ